MKLVESKALVFETEEYPSATAWNKRRVGVKVGGILVGMVEKATRSEEHTSELQSH